ncbi:MAG: hypothetical protein VX951_10620 [Planctomycetota bacterium]|nr:hypothetical protein [Planctomycetota bacterium]
MADLFEIADRVLLGESLRDVAVEYRNTMLIDMGFDPENSPDELFTKETTRFMNKVCRHLGERHAGDQAVAAELEAWVCGVNEYDAFDALLAHFEFPSRPTVLERGRILFPGPMTAHWDDQPG